MKCICFSRAQKSSPQLGTHQAAAAGSAMLACAIKHPLAQKQAAVLDLASSEHLPSSRSVPSSDVGQRRAAARLTLRLYPFSVRNNWRNSGERRERCTPSLPTPHVLLVPKLSHQLPSVWRGTEGSCAFPLPLLFCREPLGGMIRTVTT